MLLLPALHLRHGRPDAAEAGPVTAAEVAEGWAAARVTWAHVVDVDAALGGRNQWSALSRMLGGRVRVQFGGGVRSMLQVQQLLELGVERVAVGTQGVLNPPWVRELCRLFPGRVSLAVDVEGRAILVKGRTSKGPEDVVAFARSVDDAGLASLVVTAVPGPALDRALVAELRRSLPRTDLVVAAPLADLDWLSECGVAGVVVPPGAGAEELAGAVARYPQPRSEAHLLRVVAGHEDPDGFADEDGADGLEDEQA